MEHWNGILFESERRNVLRGLEIDWSEELSDYKKYSLADWCFHRYIEHLMEAIEGEVDNDIRHKYCEETTDDGKKEISKKLLLNKLQLNQPVGIEVKDNRKDESDTWRKLMNAILQGYEGTVEDNAYQLLFTEKGKYEFSDYDLEFFDWLVDLNTDRVGKAIRNVGGKNVSDITEFWIMDRIKLELKRMAVENNQLELEKINAMWENNFGSTNNAFGREYERLKKGVGRIEKYLNEVFSIEDGNRQIKYMEDALDILDECEEKLYAMHHKYPEIYGEDETDRNFNMDIILEEFAKLKQAEAEEVESEIK